MMKRRLAALSTGRYAGSWTTRLSNERKSPNLRYGEPVMSIGSLGIVGSLAGAPLAGKTSDADKAREASANQQRQVHADAQAENAAGIGQTQEDSAANDRDADGRQ